MTNYELEIKRKLNKILASVFLPDYDRLKNFKVQLVDYKKTYAGKYNVENSTIIICKNELSSDDLFYATALHELTHHIQYEFYANTRHDKKFINIYQQLLITAFHMELIDASRLLLIEQVLVNMKDGETVSQICIDFLKREKERPRFVLEISSFKENKKSKFSKKLNCYYCFKHSDKQQEENLKFIIDSEKYLN